LAEVAKRQLVEPVRLVVDVERAPAAAARLHPGGPCETAVDGVLAEAEAPERERDDRRVVDVRVEVVLKLERPAPGWEIRLANRPVPAAVPLLVDEPLARPAQGGVTRRHACVEQRDDRKRCVPDRRLAGLWPQTVALVDGEALPAIHRGPERLVLEPVAQGCEH